MLPSRAASLFNSPLLGLLGKLHAQNKMLETVSVHLVAGFDGIGPVGETDESKALGHARLSVLGQEHTGDAAEALEHVAQLALLCHLRDL
jgi:hypothetical protein